MLQLKRNRTKPTTMGKVINSRLYMRFCNVAIARRNKNIIGSNFELK